MKLHGNRREFSKMFPNQLAILVLLASAITKSLCLRISSVEVPPAVMNSSQVTLVCNYDLEGDQLYSVKWYKNYVEFFRFQPNLEPGGGGVTSNAQASGGSAQSRLASTSAADNQPHSKHEFEWDGINLNLSKSNATHVYLQQVSLASEGTYKCEVSAESPSFATVSIERQMKVYILPKQKLSIVDNSMSNNIATTTTTTNQLNQRSSTEATKQTLAYNINDFVNLTCLSSSSRPPARLTWLINDAPVPASSKWLQQTSETKLTLAFRLQPGHLLKGSGNMDPVTRHQSLKLRCVAKLSVEYSSESSIIVSGGKTTIRRRQELSSQLPAPSSLSSLQSATEAGGARGGSGNQGPLSGSSGSTEYPIYRWPRPLVVSPPPGTNGRHTQTHGGRKNFSHESISDPYGSTASSGGSQASGGSSSELAEVQQDGLATNGDHYDGSGPFRTGGSRSANSRHLVVWTSRQLRDQAEHIDFVMRLARPNELDTPLIEGKIQLEELEGDTSADGWTTNEPPAKATSSLASDSDATYIGAHKKPSPQIQANINQDYELDDLVQFTCKPRVALIEGNAIKSVISRWFINNKEISVHLVNAFDGNKFYYSQNQYDMRPALSLPSNNLRPLQSAQNQNPSSESNDTQYTSLDSTSTEVYASTPMLMIPVEFTSSLFQLKELNLKCRTIVEQPLIQYDSQVIISVPTNQFVQATNDNRPGRTGGAFFRNTNSKQNGRVYSNQRARNSNGRSSPSSSGSRPSTLSETSWPYCPLFILANCLIAKHLYR